MKQFKYIAFYSLSAILILILIGFAGVKHSEKAIKDVVVDIRFGEDNLFTDEREVLLLLNADNTDHAVGRTISELNLRELEGRVEKNRFVKDAQIFRDLKGNLVVKVNPIRPIARVINKKGQDLYIDPDGYIVNTSVRHTARVPIIEFDKMPAWKNAITETEYGVKLLELLNHIEQDEFWKAQIAGLIIEKDGEVKMLPQVTKQDIYFGQPEDVESKFMKLKVFYTEILPNKGWNTYSRVNVKFKNQIVCE